MIGPAQRLSKTPEWRLHRRIQEVVRLARRDIERAARDAESLVEEYPYSPGAWLALGTIRLRQQDAQGAIGPLERAVRARPAFAPGQQTLGRAYEALGRQDAARDAFARAISLDPDVADTHFRYSRFLLLAGDRERGMRHFRRGLAILATRAAGMAAAPPGVLTAAASSYLRRRGRGGLRLALLEGRATRAFRRGRFELAAGLAQAALSGAAPDDPRLLRLLGRAWLELGNCSLAVRALRQALSADQEDPALLADLAYAEAHTAWQDEAPIHLGMARERGLRSRDARRRAGFALLQTGSAQEAVGTFTELVEQNAGDSEAAYGLGVAYGMMGRLDDGRRWLARTLEIEPAHGQALLRLAFERKDGRGSFDPETVEALLERTTLTRQQRMLIHFAAGAICDARGIQDRAFRHFVAANELKDVSFDPDGETHRFDLIKRTFDRDFFERVRGAGIDDPRPIFIVGMPRSGSTLVEQIIASHPHAHGAGELEEMPRLALNLIPSIHYTAGALGASPALGRDDVRAAGEAYLQLIEARASGAERFVDKMLYNFLHLGLVAGALPRARVIHCRRDPMDTCLSIYMRHFTGSFPFAYDLRNLAIWWNLYDDLMAHWHEVLPLPILTVDYERLVGDQEATTRRILDFCGLSWDARCLAFHDGDRVVRTSSYAQVRAPIYRHGVGGWRRFEAELEPLNRRLANAHGSRREFEVAV